MNLDSGRCKHCHNPVLWATLPSGKKAPLDPPIRYLSPDPPPPKPTPITLVLHSGQTETGHEVGSGYPGARGGRVNHWATCPKREDAKAERDAQTPLWRERLTAWRAEPCPSCTSTGPHTSRCTPWTQHWGEVRCGGCARHLRWIPKPPEADRGAWTKHLACQEAWDGLEAHLDSRGLQWAHKATGLVILTRPLPGSEERAQIAACVQRVREAFGWELGQWVEVGS